MPKPLKQAIAYVRVSTKDQKEHGFGLELQEAYIEAYARHAGYEIIAVFGDSETAMGTHSIKERGGVQEAMEMAKHTGHPIVVSGLSRFSRDSETVQRIVLENEIRLLACDSDSKNPQAVIMANAELAQRQGEIIRRTTKQGLAAARNRGVVFGNRKNLPEAQQKGSAANKRQADVRARELAQIVQEFRQAGRVTAKEIAEGLNQKGFLTPSGELWNAPNLRRPLARIKAMEAEIAAERQHYEKNPLYGAFSSGAE